MTAPARPYRVIFQPGHGFTDRFVVCNCGAHRLTDQAGAVTFTAEHAGCTRFPPMSNEVVEHHRRMTDACPHGPDEPCTCPGCHDGEMGCTGYTVGCTCDIDWEVLYELSRGMV